MMGKLILRNFRQVLCLLVVAIVSAGTGLAASIEWTVPDEAVAQLPLPISFKVFGPAEVPETRVLDDILPFQVRLEDENGVAFVFQENTKRAIATVNKQSESVYQPVLREVLVDAHTIRVGEGETIVLVADLMNCERRVENASKRAGQRVRPPIPAGVYKVSVQSSIMDVTPELSVIELREPNAAEQRFIRRAGRVHGYVETNSSEPFWRSFVRLYPKYKEDLNLNELSDLGRKQLSYHLAVAACVSATDSLTSVAEDMSRRKNSILSEYEKPLELLEFAAQSQAGLKDAAAVGERIIEEEPGWTKAIDGIREGGGFLNDLRATRDDYTIREGEYGVWAPDGR